MTIATMAFAADRNVNQMPSTTRQRTAIAELKIMLPWSMGSSRCDIMKSIRFTMLKAAASRARAIMSADRFIVDCGSAPRAWLTSKDDLSVGWHERRARSFIQQSSFSPAIRRAGRSAAQSGINRARHRVPWLDPTLDIERSSDRGIVRKVCTFDRGPELDPSGRQFVSLRRNESSHVDHLQKFTFAEALQHRPPQAELNGASRQRLAVGIVIGIPLQADFRTFHCQLPFVMRRVSGMVETRRNGFRQDAVEEGASQTKSQRDFLALFGTPAGSIHHPEKIGLDPAHARVGEIAAECAVRDGIFSDRWSIGLIDDDGVRVVLGKDVLAFGRPAVDLIEVEIGREVHDRVVQLKYPRRGIMHLTPLPSSSSSPAPSAPAPASRTRRYS